MQVLANTEYLYTSDLGGEIGTKKMYRFIEAVRYM